MQDFVIHADEYCSVQEHVIINFINFIFQMSITNMYIQNPPKNIREQIYRTFDKSIIHETQQPYLEVSKEMIQTFNSQYSERVIGQERAKKKLLQAIYPLVDGKQSKPVVILLYGDSGLGKTESAQYMAELMGGKLLRKQFSMYQNNESANYIFGGRYNEKSFAQDLLAKPVYKRYELKNKILIPFPHNGRQEYTELMKIVYRFALGDADGYELVIGNIMRQVLEAFSTFQYKKGIEEVSTDRSILAILPEKEYQSYFENLMYRLILNNGSHRLDQTRSMSDMNFFTVISDSEKKRTAKEILCFIYLLNEKHVLAHLDGCSNVQSNLSKWCNDVKNKVGA